MTNNNKGTALKMTGIVKTFPGVRALNQVDFEVEAGHIHGLVGENGAGKSTLMKVLGGIYNADSGTIELNGRPGSYSSPVEAIDEGICVVHQEHTLIPDMDGARNVFLGKEPVKGKLGIIDWKRMYKRTREILDSMAVSIDLKIPVKDLSQGDQKFLEIARALVLDAKILVMDEPSAVFTDVEVEILFKVIKSIQESGVSIIYISHKLEEVLKLTDRISVMKDGELVSTVDSFDITKDGLISLMIGQKLDNFFMKRELAMGDTMLEVKSFTHHPVVNNVSFDIRAGEIFGVFGLVGAGRTELAKMIYGEMNKENGEIAIDGRQGVKINSPYDAIKSGVGFIPEDRRKEGVILDLDILENICISSLDKYRKYGFIDLKKKRKATDDLIKKFNIKTPSRDKIIKYLSGGNQQKAIIGRWANVDLKVLIFDEPTIGIDVGAKKEIYSFIMDLAESGLAILFISSEIEEVMGISDRIMVMHNGEKKAVFDTRKVDQEEIMKAAFGEST